MFNEEKQMKADVTKIKVNIDQLLIVSVQLFIWIYNQKNLKVHLAEIIVGSDKINIVIEVEFDS